MIFFSKTVSGRRFLSRTFPRIKNICLSIIFPSGNGQQIHTSPWQWWLDYSKTFPRQYTTKESIQLARNLEMRVFDTFWNDSFHPLQMGASSAVSRVDTMVLVIRRITNFAQLSCSIRPLRKVKPDRLSSRIYWNNCWEQGNRRRRIVEC